MSDSNLLQWSYLNTDDLDEMVSAFKKLGWNKPRSVFENYYSEQIRKERLVVVVRVDGEFAGYVTLRWESPYLSFRGKKIPELCDLNVLPPFRRKGIGAQLVAECERLAKERGHTEIGLGVGLIHDYGSAQRLYFKLGFVPDGNGLHYGTRLVTYGELVKADDDLVIYFRKRLP
jgi:GNAT superfamily N-acetyltransferase